MRRLSFLLLLLLAVSGPAKAAAVETFSITSSDGHEIRLKVEVARTPMERAFGLMERTALPEKNGMLFLFEKEERPRMWMKNTLIPLDMIFISAEGRILQIHANAEPESLEIIEAEKPSKAVLEINGGAAKRWHVRVGDKVSYAAFREEPPR